MKMFRVHCRRCGRFDEDCLLCSATTVTCGLYRLEQEWVISEFMETQPLFFGPRVQSRMVKYETLDPAEREEIDIQMMARKCGCAYR